MLLIEYRRRLPHIQPVGACFFITFTLKGAIPAEVALKLKETYQQQRQGLDATARYVEYKRHFARIDAILDKAQEGNLWLKRDDIATIVKANLHRHDTVDYDLLAYCIMANHVHVVLDMGVQLEAIPLHELATELNYKPLSTLLRLIKGRSAREANQLLTRSGAFWQPESYDHYVRDANELNRIIDYTLQNPVKAGLVDDWQAWPHTYLSSRYL